MWDTEVAELLGVLNEGFPKVEEMTGPEARAVVAARRAPVTNVEDVLSAHDIRIPAPHGDIGARVYQPRPEDRGDDPPVIVFFHGGGFVFCDLESHDGFCRAMARGAGAVVVSVDYRRAPEHRAPAAAEDALTAMSWVIEHATELGSDPGRVLAMGDSAGGNLAAVACIMARDAALPMPAGQVLLYPVIDPGCDTESAHRYATGHFNTLAATRWYWQQYLPEGGSIPAPTSRVAPLTAEHHRGVPPAIVVTAGTDPLSSEGHAYAAALRQDGVRVLHRDYGGLFHGFLTILPLRAAASAREVLWRDLTDLVRGAVPGQRRSER